MKKLKILSMLLAIVILVVSLGSCASDTTVAT